MATSKREKQHLDYEKEMQYAFEFTAKKSWIYTNYPVCLRQKKVEVKVKKVSKKHTFTLTLPPEIWYNSTINN
jgi:hypothetical protein